MTTTTVTLGAPCPRCSATTVTAGSSAVSWCPDCELGLDTYDPSVAPWRGTRWLGRWGFRRAFVLDDELRSQIIADPSSAAIRTRGETVLIAVSALIVVVSLACFVGAVLVWFRSDWVPPVRFLASVALVLLGVWTRPRFGRLPKGVVQIPADQTPALRGVIRSVAASVGTQEPDVLVLVADEANMAVTRVGLRGRSVLMIGIPLWLLLAPEMRVAVLAHELGHLTNRDPLRSTLTRPATAMFARAVEWTGGHRPWRAMSERLDRAEADTVVAMVFRLLLATFNTAFATIQLAIEAVAMPDHRRAEYAADLASRDAAGSRATVAALDRITLLGELVDGLVHDVVTRRPADWTTLADRRHGQLQGELPLRRQASRRVVDLWVTHPPVGSRAALVEGLPVVPGTVPVDPEQFARIDAELANWYAAAHRTILGARDFLG